MGEGGTEAGFCNIDYPSMIGIIKWGFAPEVLFSVTPFPAHSIPSPSPLLTPSPNPLLTPPPHQPPLRNPPPTRSPSPPHNPHTHPPPPQPPRPTPQHAHHDDRVEHQRAPEDNGIVAPRGRGAHVDPGDGDGPGQHPEQVRAEGLVEVPAGGGGEEDGGEEGRERVEDVAPVDGLWGGGE